MSAVNGAYTPDFASHNDPVLVSASNSIGTKLKIAFLLNRQDTVGIDCAALCANDVIERGAKPLFLHSYLILGRMKPEIVSNLTQSVEMGCELAGCTFLGSDAKEMPGFFQIDEYDLTGFCVGMADRDKLINSGNAKPGDVIIGISSSGLHADGFTMVRHVLRVNESNVYIRLDELDKTLGEELLTPTRCYAPSMLKLFEQCTVSGVAHITKGGLRGNIPKLLSSSTAARIECSAIKSQPIFNIIRSMGLVGEQEMFNCFNMGIGMAFTVDKQSADKALSLLRDFGEDACVIGEIVGGFGAIKVNLV